jgi:hypothetical protein
MALYCYYTAKRLDRLHSRIDMAAAALDAQLRNRHASTQLFLDSGVIPEPDAGGVRIALAALNGATRLDHDREVAENALSRALAALAADRPQLFMAPGRPAAQVHDEALRAMIARRFYNDTVRDALVVRDRRVVRWLGLAGRAPHPAYFEMDDEELPAPRVVPDPARS